MSLARAPHGQTARLTLAGELTIYSVAETKAGLADAMRSADDIEVDLAGLTEIDTAGLQLMLLAKRRPGKNVRFINHPACVLRLIDLAHLGRVLGDPLYLPASEATARTP